MLMLMFIAGFLVGTIGHLIAMAAYKNTLTMVGNKGGSENINGVWYRITKEETPQ